jgi:DNA-binding NarL/FixJ family response regulator
MAIRILLVDDHKIMRDGLRAVLEKEPAFQIVAEASNGREAVDAATRLKPDIIIMDVVMPEINGIEATIQIRKKCPEARIIALTMHADKGYLTRMLRAGTAGYLLKDCAAEELVKALRDIIAGKRYISSDIAALLLDDYTNQPTQPMQVGSVKLNPREMEFLRLLADGLTPREIADQLQVSIKTIERSRQHLMEKLQLFTPAELIKYAVRHGIATLA